MDTTKPLESNVTIRNEIWGLDVLNQHLWFARQIKDETYWEGTGLDQHAINTFVDFKAALSFFLTNYTKTDTIQGVLNGQYRIAFPHNAAAITILDAVAKELGQ